MTKWLFPVAAAVVVALFAAIPLTAAEEKEVKLTGTLVCAKCKLKTPGVSKCTNALQVKEGEKVVTYFLVDKGNDETYHEDLCGGGEKAGVRVTGIVTEKDGKKWIKPSKVG